MKILIVDDTVSWAILVKFWLKKLGIEYDYVDNGYTAIEYLQQNTYDLMITDIIMPKMGGFKLVEYVKKHYDIIIAVMSNHDEYIKLMIDTEYKFQKPNTFKKFKEIINILIKSECNLIVNNECNLKNHGECDKINKNECFLYSNNNELVKGIEPMTS